MNYKSWLRVILAGVSLFVCSCMTLPPGTMIASYEVQIDSYSKGGGANYSFGIIPGDPEISIEDIQFSEIRDFVVYALEKKGNKFSGNSGKEDVIIKLSYTIEKPQERTEIYSTPIFANNTIVGSYTNSNNYQISQRVVQLEAFSRSTNKQLWKTHVLSTGTSNDLRKTIPYMMAASWSLIGENTGSMLTCNIKESDLTALEFLEAVTDKKHVLGDGSQIQGVTIRSFATFPGTTREAMNRTMLSTFGKPTSIRKEKDGNDNFTVYEWMVPGKTILSIRIRDRTKTISQYYAVNLDASANRVKELFNQAGMDHIGLNMIGLTPKTIIEALGEPVMYNFGPSYFNDSKVTISLGISNTTKVCDSICVGFR